MNQYDGTGYTQPQPRHNAHQGHQSFQQHQAPSGYTSQKYNPNAYQPQPAQARPHHMASPPPLQHPVPTRPPVQMREPAPTPSPRMNYAQAHSGPVQGGPVQGGSIQSNNQYNPNKYRPQQHQQQQQSQQRYQQQQQVPQRSSFERSSFDQSSYGSPQQQYMTPQQPVHQYQHQPPHQHSLGQGQGQGQGLGQGQGQGQGLGQGQGQGQPAIPSFPFNLNDGTTQLGMQFGKSAVMAGQEYVEQNLNRWINRAALQPYFNVSNSYVINKLKLLVFPWRHKQWTRLLRRSETTGEVTGFLSPRDDINAPDLYIPVMAFVSYVLLVAISAGTANKFSPEILGPTASSALAVILLEFTMIKLCTYILNIDSEVSMLDLLAYSGYKFVGIILSIMVQLSNAPKSLFWAMFLYTGAATGFFLLRALRYVILPESSAGTVQTPQRKRRIHFLICLSVLQFGFMWILV
ncbi:hypothetical protein BGZ94_008897 [Podila epigama]|nr:hypothetical protein BGZ94_008897 [Podila epigama]